MTNANDVFAHFTGTENYYQHFIPGIVYTDGVQALAEKCEAYWLLDILASHQTNKKVKIHHFQVWKMNKFEGGFQVVASDGNGNEIARQHGEYTDFPYDECTLYLSDNVILLPSEY